MREILCYIPSLYKKCSVKILMKCAFVDTSVFNSCS